MWVCVASVSVPMCVFVFVILVTLGRFFLSCILFVVAVVRIFCEELEYINVCFLCRISWRGKGGGGEEGSLLKKKEAKNVCVCVFIHFFLYICRVLICYLFFDCRRWIIMFSCSHQRSQEMKNWTYFNCQ